MNRRGFLWAAVAAGLALGVRGPAEEKPREHEQVIRAALGGRRLLEFTYHEHKRLVEPHALGRLRDGTVVLLAWQVAGGSRSEPPPGWRTFLLADIRSLTVAEVKFTPRADYRPEKTKLRVILTEVAHRE